MGYKVKKKFGKTWATGKTEFKSKRTATRYAKETYPNVPSKIVKIK